MRDHIAYFVYIAKHKYYVLEGGLRLGGIPLWRLLAAMFPPHLGRE